MRVPRRRVTRSEDASERRSVRRGRVVLARFGVATAATASCRSRAGVQQVPRRGLRRGEDCWASRTDRDGRRGLLSAGFPDETF